MTSIEQKIIRGYRLSPQQQRLWLLQKNDDSLDYRAKCEVLIEGNLKTEILQLVIKNIIKKHEILRTSFNCQPGVDIPLQVITDEYIPLIHEYNFTNLEPDEQEIKLEAIFDNFHQLEQKPLWYLALVKLSSFQHKLLVSLPALYADTATLKNLVSEVSRYYTAYLQGESLADEPIQYVDVAEVFNELIESEETQLGKKYWQQYDISPIFNFQLYWENQTAKKERFTPKFIIGNINPELAQNIENTVKIYHTSTSLLFLACWQVLLGRLTGQLDTIVGMAFDGRAYEGLESALGLFAKYLPLRCQLTDNSQFHDLLPQLSELINQLSQWQEYFTWEENEIELPFFPICFEFEEYSQQYAAGDISFSITKQYSYIDRFKLKLCCVRRHDGLGYEIHYDANLFLVADIQRLAGQFETLLASVVNNPTGAIASFNIISPIERQHLLGFNNTQITALPYQCIHHWFESQVSQTPDNIAVVFEKRQLTYTELNVRANQLAHYLQKLGIKPDALVGICMERSLEMVVAILGVLKAGGAYLPLDATYPQERLAWMVQDAQLPVLLTQQKLVEGLPEHNAQVICLDTDWLAIAQENSHNPVSKVSSENLAYVIYTSGSTGKPKGVMNTHQGLCNRLLWMQDTYQLTLSDHVLQKTPFSFDVSVWEFFWPILTGARLVVARPEGHKDSTYLVKLITQEQITTIHFVPSMLRIFLDEPGLETCISLKRVICSGEALPFELQERFFTRLNAQLHNLYGPTEAAIDVTFWHCEHHSQHKIVPIGRAIANTQIYLLDRYFQLVPVGVPGELYIGGVNLARGYLNRPDLTAQKFIPNLFSDQPGARLYKTGDLAQYLRDGNIQFIGRIDDQIKLRGFRIELGEIEAVLSQHWAVKEAVVVAQADESNQKRLVAYVVLNQQLASSTTDLRNFVKEQLPEYMIPAAFVQLSALPLTPNGKVDRQALPAPDTVRPDLETTYIAPRTPVEETLARIWTQVLGLKEIGIHDNFFEVGGDSILSIQVIAKARQVGIQLSTNQIFDHQTIAELAKVADTTQIIQAEQGVITGLLPITPIQQWFLAQNQPDSHHWNQAILLEVRQAIDYTLLEQALQQLLVHHDALRLRFVQTEFGWQQINSDAQEAVSFARLDLSTLSPSQQESAIAAATEEVQTGLNLSQGPLMRVVLFDFGGQKSSQMLMAIHHLAIDGVSWGILLEDLHTAYQQLSRGEAIALPLKTTSFKRWAERLKEYAQSSELQQELNYWLAEPRKYVTYLPVDNPEGDNLVASAQTVSVALSVEETQALLQEVHQVYRTQINDLLLTAVVQAFAQWTGEQRLLLYVEGHGRENIFADIDVSHTVGWFTTIFPVLLDLGGTTQPAEALQSVKEQLRQIPNQGIGYGALRYMSEDVEIVKQLQALPQAQIIFNYLGQLDRLIPVESMFALAHLTPELSRSPKGYRTYWLECNGFVMGGKLQLEWTYSQKMYKKATIESLAQNCLEKLRSLIIHCQSSDAGGYTIYDFPDLELSPEKLEKILAEIDLS